MKYQKDVEERLSNNTIRKDIVMSLLGLGRSMLRFSWGILVK